MYIMKSVVYVIIYPRLIMLKEVLFFRPNGHFLEILDIWSITGY